MELVQWWQPNLISNLNFSAVGCANYTHQNHNLASGVLKMVISPAKTQIGKFDTMEEFGV